MPKAQIGSEDRKNEIEQVKKEETKLKPFGNSEHSDKIFEGGKDRPIIDPKVTSEKKG